MSDNFRDLVAEGIPETVPSTPAEAPGISHAPPRQQILNAAERRLALRNALRYLPASHHEEMAPELARELREDGHIYMRRYRPAYPMHARPIEAYPARCQQAAAIMLMITNNLDPKVAQHPYELVTYGGNGAVFQNWAQYRLTMRYLSRLEHDQTLVMYSGHPLGVFPSHPDAPRVVVTNGMVVPNYSSLDDYERMNALGVTSYGQMTAGSYMYIGPQGIVHGTTITLLNAGRRYLDAAPEEGGLGGKLFVTSGLGGMSGAQAKAAVIAGCVGVVAEVNEKAVRKRHEQGWVQEVEADLDKLLLRIARARAEKKPLSLAYIGNIVDLWEALDRAGEPVELGSDQTSLHNPYAGGYYPAGLTVEQSQKMMSQEPEAFRDQVHASLRRQVEAVKAAVARGMAFFDYGNAFLLQASRAGADICKPDGSFIYPSYVEDIMGPMCFDHGFGPFRWVCTSCDPADLARTDAIASRVMGEMAAEATPETRTQHLDNKRWIDAAGENKMVVGSQARILYSDWWGRTRIAAAFNDAIRSGEISAPVVLGRDHHDVSGTDSPFRETANIYDGSRYCADMAVHNVIGDAFRGATWVSLHNGGGVGWGEVMNGGFGMVLDGTDDADRRLRQMLHWDVNNGIARRSWAGNDGARLTAQRAMEEDEKLRVTLPALANTDLIENAITRAYDE